MKKVSFCVLAVIMAMAFAIPASATPQEGFIGGTVVAADKNTYDCFIGEEITANNNTVAFDNFYFIADNKILNTWYINVTKDIAGALDVAYKIGSGYYIVSFNIDGPGKYRIADSRGVAGANMVKIGEFNAAIVETGVLDIWTHWYSDPDTDPLITPDIMYEIYDNGVFDFNINLSNGYGILDTNKSDKSFTGKASIEVPLGEIVDFKFDPPTGEFYYNGYTYTWEFGWIDSPVELNATGDGVYFIAGSIGEIPEKPYVWSVEIILHFKLSREILT